MRNTRLHKGLRIIKRCIQAVRGRDYFFTPDIYPELIRLGSDYGGWHVPKNELNSASLIYSAGIGTDISFDLALIESFGVDVHAFDPTPKSIEWLKKQELPSGFHYYAWGFADYDGTAQFHIPRNPAHVSHSIISSQVTSKDIIEVDVRKIDSIMAELQHTKIDLLKMDIEGSEYSVLTDLLKHDLRPTLLLIEFHHRFKSIGAAKTKQAVKNLRDAGYVLYSISASGEELCFRTKT